MIRFGELVNRYLRKNEVDETQHDRQESTNKRDTAYSVRGADCLLSSSVDENSKTNVMQNEQNFGTNCAGEIHEAAMDSMSEESNENSCTSNVGMDNSENEDLEMSIDNKSERTNISDFDCQSEVEMEQSSSNSEEEMDIYEGTAIEKEKFSNSENEKTMENLQNQSKILTNMLNTDAMPLFENSEFGLNGNNILMNNVMHQTNLQSEYNFASTNRFSDRSQYQTNDDNKSQNGSASPFSKSSIKIFENSEFLNIYRASMKNSGEFRQNDLDAAESELSRISNFRCAKCNYETWRHSRLKDHTATHIEQKRFECMHKGCNYSTNRNSDLKRHGKTKHKFNR